MSHSGAQLILGVLIDENEYGCCFFYVKHVHVLLQID
jgi:hypothetical protein